MTIRPASGRSKPAIIRSVVVFPQPDGPSSEKNSPLADLERHVVDGRDVVERLAHLLEDDRLRAKRRHRSSSRMTHEASSMRAASRSSSSEVDDRVQPVRGCCEAPTCSVRVHRARDGAVLTPFVEQPHDSLRPGSIALLDERSELLVVAEARPHLVPERRCLLELRVDRPDERPFGPLGAGRQRGELGLQRLDAEVLRVGERRAKELLARREVVVDERAGHARLLRDGPDAQVARAATDDDATCSTEDLVDAARRGGRVSRLLRSRHPQYPD